MWGATLAVRMAPENEIDIKGRQPVGTTGFQAVVEVGGSCVDKNVDSTNESKQSWTRSSS